MSAAISSLAFIPRTNVVVDQLSVRVSVGTSAPITTAQVDSSFWTRSRRSVFSIGAFHTDAVRILKPDAKNSRWTPLMGMKVEASVSWNQTEIRDNEWSSRYVSSGASPRTKHDLYQILKYPVVSDSTIKELADNNTLVFVVDRHASKQDIKVAVKTMFGLQTRKVNTLTRRDGTKKAYVMLTADYNASDLARKFKII